MYEYKDTVDLMLSDDYKIRFTGEYLQLKLRYEKLKAFANEIEVAQMKGWPEPIHDTPLELLCEQQKCMGQYLACLEKRAIIENVALPS